MSDSEIFQKILLSLIVVDVSGQELGGLQKMNYKSVNGTIGESNKTRLIINCRARAARKKKMEYMAVM